MITTTHNQAESDFKDYGKERPVVGLVWLSWILASVMRAITQADWIVARPNVGKFLFCEGQGLWLESGLEPRNEDRLGLEFKSDFLAEYKLEPGSTGNLRDSGAPPVSHRGQTCRPFLPHRQKLQEEMEILETVPISDNVCQSCR